MAPEDVSKPDDDENSTPRPFDVQTVRFLIKLMSRHDLSEIDLSEGDRRIRLRRGVSPGKAAAEPQMVNPAPVSVPPPPAESTTPTAESVGEPAKKLMEIKSPTPGNFYARPNPEAPEFVKVGDRVEPDTVVCLVEAMKMFNEIKAECSGVIVEVVAEDRQFVEYNTVLFRVDPAG